MKQVVKEAKLIFSDIGNNNNKFYYLYLYDDGSLSSKNGRVGTTSIDNELPKLHGEYDFEKQVKSKLKKGYSEFKGVATSAGQVTSVPQNNLQEIAKKQIQTTKPELQKLIDRLVKANIHQITSSTQITYSDVTGLFSTPLGIITLDAVNEARNLLVQINDFIIKSEYTDKKLFNLAGNYLRLVPSSLGMKLDLKKIFPDSAAIQQQNSILDSLEASFNTSQNQPKKDGAEIKEEKVFDVELDVLEDEKEIERIRKWFYSSNHSVHGYSNVKIANYYQVKIRDNWKRFNEKLGNVTEVFHSTSEANILSILKTGLKLSPPASTKISGSLFGAGHYGAVDSSKSLQYTLGRFGGSKGESGWSWVADFALGKTSYIKSYGGPLQKGFDSIWAKKENTGLRFDELIVPTDEQVRLKYLLEVR